jgi:hypothetical protein
MPSPSNFAPSNFAPSNFAPSASCKSRLGIRIPADTHKACALRSPAGAERESSPNSIEPLASEFMPAARCPSIAYRFHLIGPRSLVTLVLAPEEHTPRPNPDSLQRSTMKLSDNVKETRLHRLYQVVFWTLLILPFPVIAFSVFVQKNLTDAQVEVGVWARHAGIPYQDQLPTILASQHTIDTYSTICFVSLAALIFAMLMPLLYRLFLYVLHGRAAFNKSK